MDYDKLLGKYEQMKASAEKYQKKYKSFKDGYRKAQRKLGEVAKQNQDLKKQIKNIKTEHINEIAKYKMLVQKYKRSGLDFATKKKVLDLQQTVNIQEEGIFKLKEKIKDKNRMITNHVNDTKRMRQENIDIKNVLNNIQLQINQYLPPKSSEASSVIEPLNIQPIVKEQQTIVPEPVIEQQQKEIEKEEIIEEPKIIEEPEAIKEESESESESESSSDSEIDDKDYESDEQVDTGFLSD